VSVVADEMQKIFGRAMASTVIDRRYRAATCGAADLQLAAPGCRRKPINSGNVLFSGGGATE
jgi:hypothetical protein